MSAPQENRRLILLRHAKAEHPEGLVDHARPLALQGRRQSTRVGAVLGEAGLVPDLVWCSTSLRTRQTWELVRANLGAEAPVEYLDEIYDAGTRGLLDLVRTAPESVGTLLVVGHEPTMSHVAALLAGEGSDEAARARVHVGVPTASWTLLEAPDWDAFEPGAARLVRLTTPD